MISFILHKLKLKLKFFVGFHSTMITFLFDNFSYHCKNSDIHSYEKYFFCFDNINVIYKTKCYHKNEAVNIS